MKKGYKNSVLNIQEAANDFCKAAGVFQTISSAFDFSSNESKKIPELNATFSTMMLSVSLGLAQELVYRKATNSGSSKVLTLKLIAAARDYYTKANQMTETFGDSLAENFKVYTRLKNLCSRIEFLCQFAEYSSEKEYNIVFRENGNAISAYLLSQNYIDESLKIVTENAIRTKLKSKRDAIDEKLSSLTKLNVEFC